MTTNGRLDALQTLLRPCEYQLLERVRSEWAIPFGTREVRVQIEYQDRVPVLMRVLENVIREEKLK